ncbi:laccase domain protein YlmD [Pullulanibacillus camelliae]|uniref:Purine nucleoside phosphorylase n=1 Tax=Pullulanibacillus camelliae TaxID=1707096 RepID=A0A8J2VZK0_9BACL|nr:peptidoglycan editing factor PgeF [Pullulanibacillus camelliae]GGE41426.1 laccase domain protein YlmD [Pullulanibacillus camelliae]
MATEPFIQQSIEALELAPIPFSNGQIRLGFTSRNGGYSPDPYASFNMGYHVGDAAEAVTNNRLKLGECLHISTDQWVTPEQVHGNTVLRVTKEQGGQGALDLESAISSCDGLYTTDRDLLLTACFADCVPVFFYSKKTPVVGIAHAGWKGTAGEIVGQMVKAWQRDFVLDPKEMMAVIGPSIGKCCYEVDARVIEAIHALSAIDTSSAIEDKTAGKYMLDLKLVNKLILQKYGLLEENISLSHYCTGCRTDLFYSHRMENGRTGRMLGYIALLSGDVQ